MNLQNDTSPELAIKIAYDFARKLRITGAAEARFTEHLEKWVNDPYRNSALLVYIRAGFTAGFKGDVLPWRRDIERKSS